MIPMWVANEIIYREMDCSYCGNEVDQAAEFFEVTHRRPWRDADTDAVFCSYECLRGYLHTEHFRILYQDDTPENAS